MKIAAVQKAVLASVLLLAIFAAACGGGVEGKYRDSSGQFNAEFRDGKAYIAMGSYAVDGTYKIDGDKLIATGDFAPMLPRTIVLLF